MLFQNRTRQKEITKAINVSASTVSCEIRRNSGVRRHYNWETAQANPLLKNAIKEYMNCLEEENKARAKILEYEEDI